MRRRTCGRPGGRSSSARWGSRRISCPPEENREACFEHLLRRNHKLTGLHVEIGDEDAVFLRGSLPVAAVTDAELDRILGSMWAAVELLFRPRCASASPPDSRGERSLHLMMFHVR
ncbi:MAG: YbjN domain-containing protein [Acidimicrobiales bacterium]